MKLSHCVLGLALYLSVELFALAVDRVRHRAPAGVRAGEGETVWPWMDCP